jgi:hypothetical protein
MEGVGEGVDPIFGFGNVEPKYLVNQGLNSWSISDKFDVAVHPIRESAGDSFILISTSTRESDEPGDAGWCFTARTEHPALDRFLPHADGAADFFLVREAIDTPPSLAFVLLD